MLLNGRNDTIKFVNDYNSMIIEAKKKQPKVGLKILAPKKNFQRLPVALAQIFQEKKIKCNEINKVIKQNGYYAYEF